MYMIWLTMYPRRHKTYKQNELKQMEKQMGMQMEQNIFNQLAKEHHDEIMNFRRNRDREGLMKLQVDRRKYYPMFRVTYGKGFPY